MSDDTTIEIPNADSSADAPASSPPKKRGRPKKIQSNAPAEETAALPLPPAAAQPASTTAAETAPVAPTDPIKLPSFEIAGTSNPQPASNKGRTGDAVVFDPQKIIEQFRSQPAPTATVAPAPTPITPTVAPVAAPAPTISATTTSATTSATTSSATAPVATEPPPAPNPQPNRAAPAAPTAAASPQPPPQTAAVSSPALAIHGESPAPAPQPNRAAAAADNDDRATADDLAQISNDDYFSFSPDPAPAPAPRETSASEASILLATARETSAPTQPSRDESAPATNRPAEQQHPPRHHSYSQSQQQPPAQNQSQNGNNAQQRNWQQQQRQGNNNGANPNQNQQQGRNKSQQFSGNYQQQQQQQPSQQQHHQPQQSQQHQQQQSKHGKGRPLPNKPPQGRQWGNVTLSESVDERPVNLGAAFDYETLNTADGLAAMLTAASLSGEPIDFNATYDLSVNDLTQLAKNLGCTWFRTPPRRGMLNLILAAAPAANRPIYITGTVEILENGNGLLLYLHDDYRVKELSAFIPRQLIKRHGLQRGHEIRALAAAPRDGETCPIIVRIDKVMGTEPEIVANWLPFSELTPYYPTQRIFLETDNATATWDNLSMRCIDLLCPIGLGQRGLIVAPPRTGKTILLQGIANAILKNTPQAHLIVLLVDERPEEVTDFKRQVKQAEVVSSTFDENAESHVHAAEIVIERARRMVEAGRHVVILLDSITRLARAYNTLQPGSGKILSGGVESNALSKPKRFFGSARNIEGGGSLTILGTALVETGSKMDEVIFEEFKGTGNMELDLDRDLANKRIFPAISFERSGTRKEELLYHPDEVQKIYALRRAMKGIPSADAMEQLIQRIKKTKTNIEFLLTLGR